MSPRRRRTAVLAVALAACSPAAERRAGDATDGAAIVTGASAVDSGAASDATPGAAAGARSGVASDSASSTAAAERENIAADSVRGVVERIGSDPTSQLVVRGTDGTRCALRLAAAPSFEGLEVTLWGRRASAPATMLPGVVCAFTAERYAVRAVDGITAVDGTLRLVNATFALESADGRRRSLRDVPPALRPLVGARIYWAGPLDRAPAAYGVLAPAP